MSCSVWPYNTYVPNVTKLLYLIISWEFGVRNSTLLSTAWRGLGFIVINNNINVVVLPLRLILVKSSTVPFGRLAVDKFRGCSSGPALVHPSISATLWAVGVLGGLPYTWGCHVPATASSGDDTAATTTPDDRSAGGFLLLQSIIINISHTDRVTPVRITTTDDDGWRGHISRATHTRARPRMTRNHP